MGGDQINDLANQLLRPKDPEPILKHELGAVTFSELDQWKKILGFPESLCATRKITKTCSLHGDKHYLGISYSRCNDRKICPRCAYLSARKTAYEMYEWLKHNVVSRLPFPFLSTSSSMMVTFGDAAFTVSSLADVGFDVKFVSGFVCVAVTL